MKSKVLLLTAAIAATGLFATSASAADGTITFNGNITSSTCTIASTSNGGGGGASFVVNLPTVGTTAFAGSNPYAGRTPFSINLSNCSYAGTVKAFFEPGSTINSAGRLSNTATTGAATGVDLELLNGSLSPVDLISQSGSPTATLSSSTTSATLNYYVEYYANGAALSGGAVSSSVDYTIVYN